MATLTPPKKRERDTSSRDIPKSELQNEVAKAIKSLPGDASAFYWLIKKKSATGGLQETAKLPANEPVEDKIADSEWGGPGEYRLYLFDNDDKRIEEVKTMRVNIPDPITLNIEDDDDDDDRPLRKRGPYVYRDHPEAPSRPEDYMEVLQQNHRRMIETMQMMQMQKIQTNMLVSDDDAKPPPPQEKKDDPTMEAMRTILENMHRQTTETMQKIESAKQRDDIVSQNAQQRQETRDLILALSKRDDGSGNLTQLISSMNQQTQAMMHQMSEQNRTMVQTMMESTRSQVEMIAKQIEIMTKPRDTGWQKVLENPLFIKLATDLVKRPESSPLEKMVPELIGGVATTMMSTSTAMVQKVMEFQHAPSEDPLMQKVEAAQKIAGMITPAINEIVEKIAIRQQEPAPSAAIDQPQPAIHAAPPTPTPHRLPPPAHYRPEPTNYQAEPATPPQPSPATPPTSTISAHNPYMLFPSEPVTATPTLGEQPMQPPPEPEKSPPPTPAPAQDQVMEPATEEERKIKAEVQKAFAIMITCIKKDKPEFDKAFEQVQAQTPFIDNMIKNATMDELVELISKFGLDTKTIEKLKEFFLFYKEKAREGAPANG